MMPRLRLLPLLLLIACVPHARAQAASGATPEVPAGWLQGYARTVSGEWLVYPWSYSGQTRTLLSRATDGRMAVEWEGEAAPPGAPDAPVTYLWHAGTASGHGAHRFTLSVNGRAIATFRSGRSARDREWSIAGEAGAMLSFATTRVGQFDELFGFMWLTAPRALFGTGVPRFRVVGEAAGSQDYYLGPQEAVEEWVRVRPEEAVFADGQRAVRVAISHVRAPRNTHNSTHAATLSSTRTTTSPPAAWRRPCAVSAIQPPTTAPHAIPSSHANSTTPHANSLPYSSTSASRSSSACVTIACAPHTTTSTPRATRRRSCSDNRVDGSIRRFLYYA